MTNTPILRLALPTPLKRYFDYLAPQGVDCTTLPLGVRVEVPFQSRTLVGVLIDIVEESSVPKTKLKVANGIIDTVPLLAKDVRTLCEWAAQYYHHALGEVLASAFPPRTRVAKKTAEKKSTGDGDAAHTLNAAQAHAIDVIQSYQDVFQVILLDGITGSGKTEVYLRVIAQTLKKGQQVLVLVPEINLTPQTVNHFKARFDVSVVVLHSSLSPSKRMTAWMSARSGDAQIIIGTRSAVFTSFARLGLIVVDEEHDASFKQQDRFRYHARDLAIMRAQLLQIPIVLGSATPSLESLYNALLQKYQHVILPKRAGNALLPTFNLIDMRHAYATCGLSQTLLDEMQLHLNANNQVMIFLNRRGFAPVLFCTDCHAIIDCKRCDARMVYHRSPKRLHCHHCDLKMPVPNQCKQCQGGALQPVGMGTQRLEDFLTTHFKNIPVIRVDRDSTRGKGKMAALLAEINKDQPAILIGTQMLAKGHHFKEVTLVGVVDADSGLFSADFRAAEQMGQLLMQVAGRAGRAEKPGKVFVQTRYPDHPSLQHLIQEGYASFAKHLLEERASTRLPPYQFMAIVRAESLHEKEAATFLSQIKNHDNANSNDITLLGPMPTVMARRQGMYAQQLILKAPKRSALQAYLKQLHKNIETMKLKRNIKWLIDVDPIEM